MCILFVYVNDTPKDGTYELIIENNRDEFYARPTKAAHNWTQAPDCIGGLDLQPGRGGTWFGVSTKGKIGTLLNILQPEGPDLGTRGRGHLVPDFLTSNSTAEEFVKKLLQFRKEYNAFNLVLFEKNSEWKITYFTSEKDKVKTLSHGVFVLGNSVIDTPWQKVVKGKEIFGDLVEKYNSIKTKEDLIDGMIAMLNDRTPNMPDPQIEKQNGSDVTGLFLFLSLLKSKDVLIP